MRLTDADGGELRAKVTAIVGQSALLEWSLSARGGSLIQPGRTTGCFAPSRLVFGEIQDHLLFQQIQPALLQGFSIQIDIDAAAKVVTECIVLP